MIDTDKIRGCVVPGLAKYLGVQVIRSNQNQKPPKLPYVVYTITTVETENKGTYGVYEDGILRKSVTQIWSFSALATTHAESVKLANMARDWLDCVGSTYMSDCDVVCQSCTNVTNRDNVLSVEYEYKNGFDATFAAFNEIAPIEGEEIIKSVTINEDMEIKNNLDDLNEILEERLDGDKDTVSTLEQNIKEAISDFDKIEKALEENGINVPDGVDTSNYGDYIRRLGNSIGAVTLTKYTKADIKGGES